MSICHFHRPDLPKFQISRVFGCVEVRVYLWEEIHYRVGEINWKLEIELRLNDRPGVWIRVDGLCVTARSQEVRIDCGRGWEEGPTRPSSAGNDADVDRAVGGNEGDCRLELKSRVWSWVQLVSVGLEFR